MFTHLCLAPAAAGKTAYILAHARAAGRDLAAIPRVIVPTHLQARARRLAEAAMVPQRCGTIGVRVLTFDHLYAEVLNAAGEIYVELSEPVQYQVGASNLGGGLDPVYNCGMANGGCYQGGSFQSSGVISPLPN